MLYLAQLKPDLRHPHSRQDLQNPYEMHRTLSYAVKGALTEGQERLLWRIDSLANQTIILVQSHSQPTWSHLSAGYLLEEAKSKAFNPHFQQGQVLQFRLRANPSIKKVIAGQGQGKRYSLIGEDEQIQWLKRRGEQAGFRLLRVDLSHREQLKAYKRKGDCEKPITMLAVTFEGRLEVIDAAKLSQSLQEGIGAGKALGLGLISLAAH
ncbi:MAG: type I-E CRISPR-associated protein Cas6/Cse3/CasE [Deinococcales bacterium]